MWIFITCHGSGLLYSLDRSPDFQRSSHYHYSATCCSDKDYISFPLEVDQPLSTVLSNNCQFGQQGRAWIPCDLITMLAVDRENAVHFEFQRVPIVHASMASVILR